MRINYFGNRNGIEAKIGEENWKIIPQKVIENIRELAPNPDDGTNIEGFGDIKICLPVENEPVFFYLYKKGIKKGSLQNHNFSF